MVLDDERLLDGRLGPLVTAHDGDEDGVPGEAGGGDALGGGGGGGLSPCLLRQPLDADFRLSVKTVAHDDAWRTTCARRSGYDKWSQVDTGGNRR